MPFLESPDGAWIQTQLARMTQQARDSGFCSKDTPQAALFVPGSAELRDTIKKLQILLNFCRPLIHRAAVNGYFKDGKPYMMLVVMGNEQDAELLKKRARLLGLEIPNPELEEGR